MEGGHRAVLHWVKSTRVAEVYCAAPLMLPHLKDRPVALRRAPEGVAGGKFFQKHADAHMLPGVDRLPTSLDPGHRPLLSISSARAQARTATLKPPQIIRRPSNGSFLGSIIDASRGSFMTAAFTRSRCRRES
jgi:hypothetical protein